MRHLISCLAVLISLTVTPTLCLAWGAVGHEAVGAIADANLNPHAKAMVKSLIGISLEEAGPWLDCVKDVKGTKGNLHYVEDPSYAEGCSLFWNAEDEQSIVDFANRNWDNCTPWTNNNPCHSEYHFADVDISTTDPTYKLGLPGTNDHDVVQTIDAAIGVLQGKSAPAPFANSMDKREALLMLAHLVGDLHQPLHVGAIYLEADGHETHATTGMDGSDPGFTRGGNFLFVTTKKLHSLWDSVTAATVSQAKQIPPSAVPRTQGSLSGWAATWATQTIQVSKAELEQLRIKPETGTTHWPVDTTVFSLRPHHRGRPGQANGVGRLSLCGAAERALAVTNMDLI